MTLRVLQVPEPAAGVDWQTVVPGQYLYDVVGITAQLKTFSPLPPVAMIDASGNGNTGVYGNGTQVGLQFVDGLVVGDNALQVTGPQKVGTVTPLSSDPLTGDITIGYWIEGPASDLFVGITAQGSINPTLRFFVRGNSFGSFFQFFRGYAPGLNDFWTTGTMPVPAGPNFVAAVYTAANNHVDFYLNGVRFPAQTYAAHPMVATTDRFDFGAVGAADVQTYDEIVIYTSALSSATIAALYAAGVAGWPQWNDAVTALAPFAYYQLDDLTPDTGRNVVLEITDGTTVVADIPTGFPDPPNFEPFYYSWQPGLPSSVETPGGTITTVAIPRLILPAGYTVGTRTTDIQAPDQWEAVTLWWDDGAMEAANPLNPFAYPPGARLVYHQEVPPL